MVQPLGLHQHHLQWYYDRLFSSHDYRIDVDVLDLNEKPTGTARFLDGQVDIQDPSTLIRRTASIIVSDIHGALDFTEGSQWSGGTVWVDRLVRVRHTLHVPKLVDVVKGGNVTVTPFIGPPSTISRDGAEVTLELQDKSALCSRGTSPLTLHQGMNAVVAIRKILAERYGEFRFRLGTTKKTLSKTYNVGWSDDAAGLVVARRIAEEELNCQLFWSCDGYATRRPHPKGHNMVVPHVTAPPTDSVDFTTLSNWVRVSGKKTSKTKHYVTTTSQPVATAVVTKGGFAPHNRTRQGVPLYLPMLVDMSNATTVKQVKERADRELEKVARLQAEPSFTCVPFFHGDVDDLVLFQVPGKDVTRALHTASIPLGVADEMTVGAIRWVSQAPADKVRGHIAHTRHVDKKARAKAARAKVKAKAKAHRKGSS